MKYLVSFKSMRSTREDTLTFLNKDVAEIFIKAVIENGGEATLTPQDSSLNSLQQKVS